MQPLAVGGGPFAFLAASAPVAASAPQSAITNVNQYLAAMFTLPADVQTEGTLVGGTRHLNTISPKSDPAARAPRAAGEAASARLRYAETAIRVFGAKARCCLRCGTVLAAQRPGRVPGLPHAALAGFPKSSRRSRRDVEAAPIKTGSRHPGPHACPLRPWPACVRGLRARRLRSCRRHSRPSRGRHRRPPHDRAW